MNRKWVRILVGVVVFVLLAGIAGMVYTNRNSESFFSLAVSSQIDSNIELASELLGNTEDIVLFTIGTAAPLPSPRSQTCTVIFVNGEFFVFDVGDGAVQEMSNQNLPLNNVSGVFLTHLHSDHFIDLPSLVNQTWLMGRSKVLPVYGPVGTAKIMNHVEQMLEQEQQYRVDHHGEDIMNLSSAKTLTKEIELVENGSFIAYNQKGIKITAFDVGHEPVSPDFGYVIEYKNKKVVLSGDTNKNQNVIKHAQNADLLVHEAMLIDLIQEVSALIKEKGLDRNAKILDDITHYHTSNIEAAEVAAEANVKHLVMSHLAPVPDRKVISRQYTQGLSKIFDGEITLADDGDKFIIN